MSRSSLSIQTKIKIKSWLEYRSEQDKIQSKYSDQDLDFEACLGMDQSKAKYYSSTQTKIQIKKLAWVQIKTNPELLEALKHRSKVL